MTATEGSDVPAVPVPPTAARIGGALRQLRQQAGLSLSELARRSGVGKATLSQLEAGLRNPTLDTLFAITTELGVPLGAVLEAAGERAATGAAVDGLLVDRHDAGARVAETYRLRVRPARQLSLPHVLGTTETLIVVSGLVRTGPVDAPADLGPGQAITFTADVPHVYEGLAEDSRCMLVMTYRRPAGTA